MILLINLLMYKNRFHIIYIKMKVFIIQNVCVIFVIKLVILLVTVQLKEMYILEPKWFGYQRLTMKDPKSKGYQKLFDFIL